MLYPEIATLSLEAVHDRLTLPLTREPVRFVGADGGFVSVVTETEIEALALNPALSKSITETLWVPAESPEALYEVE